MELLFAGRIEAYLRQAALGTDPCIFVHIPKTAGTSLRSEIAGFLRPDANIAVDYTDTSRSFHDRIDDAVAMFLARAETTPVRFASGHILARHVARIRARYGDARLVTFLRDPVERVISDYRHQRSTRHPVHREFIARVPDLDAYLANRAEGNKMVQHLVPVAILRHADAAACIEHVMRSYAFVGIQAMYPICFRTLTTLLGKPAWPRLRENVNTENEAERHVDADVAQRIREANALDVALYEHFSAGMAAVQDALAEHLAAP
jgi:hypothetical protein